MTLMNNIIIYTSYVFCERYVLMSTGAMENDFDSLLRK